MLKGYDFSNWNSEEQVIDCLNRDAEFVMLKGSEGKTFVDPMLITFADLAAERSIPIGIYHFARAWANSPEDEFKNFRGVVDAVRNCTQVPGFIPVLDWEGKSLQSNRTWMESFINLCQEEWGIPPVVYVQASALDWIDLAYRHDCGLWIADWSADPGKPTTSNLWAFHQYTNSPVDTNVFNGNEDQLSPYSYKFVRETIGNKHCGCYVCEAMEALGWRPPA